jgi:ParB-like chromosome segregation protein Spo0J
MIDPVKLPTTAKLQKPQNYDNLIPHELANLLPMIEGSKFAELKEDIRKNGILEPIKLFEDRILDGRNRWKAGKEVSYKFTANDFEVFEGDYAAAEAYVFSTNFLRRQLTNAQKNDVEVRPHRDATIARRRNLRC